MLDKALQAVGDIKYGIDKAKSKKAYEKKQKRLEEERREAERIEAEKKALQDEYDRLSELDEKQLMVELIFAVRGFYSELENIKTESAQLSDRIDELESDVSHLRTELRAMGENLD